MILSFGLLLSIHGQPLTSAKVVEVTNYNEVLSQITYPRSSKENGIEGEVIVSVIIDEFGNIASHEFVSYPCNELKAEVANALPKFKFSPALNEAGETITSRFTIPIKFELTI